MALCRSRAETGLAGGRRRLPPHPPWTAFLCGGDTRLILSTDELVAFTSDERLPSFVAYTDLGPRSEEVRYLNPYLPSWPHSLEALALPFYQSVDLQQLSVFTSSRRNTNSVLLQRIRQYVVDIRYYMTLSLDLDALGSVNGAYFSNRSSNAISSVRG